MGVLNTTPDSFSDGGQFTSTAQALHHARQMLTEGAAIIDVGGESTRPGAAEVSIDDELRRVIPVIEALRADLDCLISIDTRKPDVMRAAVAAGADIINDVSALQLPGALDAAAQSGAAICLMHMQGEPRTMQTSPQYDDVVADVKAFLAQRLEACRAAGIADDRLVIDPGFGFGKTLAHNLTLLNRLDEFAELGVPLLAGMSRKSMIGAVLDKPVDERLAGSVAVAAIAVMNGAAIVRAHDVAATVDPVTMAAAVRDSQRPGG